MSEQLKAFTNIDFLYHHAPSGLISYTPDGKVISANFTLCKWLDLPEKTVKDANIYDLIHKTGALYHQMIIMPLLSIRGFVNEVNFSFKSGTGHFDVLFNAVAHKDEKEQIIVINATLQQITDRKKYESELIRRQQEAEEQKRKSEFLLNAIPNMIWTALPDGSVNFINDRTKSYFNEIYQIGQEDFKGVVTADKRTFCSAWKRAIKMQKSMEIEVRLQGQHREPEWFLLRMEPFYNSSGNLEIWFGSATNIHKRKLLQLANYSSLTESLSYAHETIDKNEERFMTIAMNQSHMIRKPLANIMGLIDLMKEEGLNKETKELLGLLDSSASELDNMIREVINKI